MVPKKQVFPLVLERCVDLCVATSVERSHFESDLVIFGVALGRLLLLRCQPTDDPSSKPLRESVQYPIQRESLLAPEVNNRSDGSGRRRPSESSPSAHFPTIHQNPPHSTLRRSASILSKLFTDLLASQTGSTRQWQNFYFIIL